MKKVSKEKKVKLYREETENGQKTTVCKTVTEKQAELVMKMSEAALYLAEAAEFYEEEIDKTECLGCKEALAQLALENIRLSNELFIVADKFVYMCDINGEFADHVRMGE